MTTPTPELNANGKRKLTKTYCLAVARLYPNSPELRKADPSVHKKCREQGWLKEAYPKEIEKGTHKEGLAKGSSDLEAKVYELSFADLKELGKELAVVDPDEFEMFDDLFEEIFLTNSRPNIHETAYSLDLIEYIEEGESEIEKALWSLSVEGLKDVGACVSYKFDSKARKQDMITGLLDNKKEEVLLEAIEYVLERGDELDLEEELEKLSFESLERVADKLGIAFQEPSTKEERVADLLEKAEEEELLEALEEREEDDDGEDGSDVLTYDVLTIERSILEVEGIRVVLRMHSEAAVEGFTPLASASDGSMPINQWVEEVLGLSMQWVSVVGGGYTDVHPRTPLSVLRKSYFNHV